MDDKENGTLALKPRMEYSLLLPLSQYSLAPFHEMFIVHLFSTSRTRGRRREEVMKNEGDIKATLK